MLGEQVLDQQARAALSLAGRLGPHDCVGVLAERVTGGVLEVGVRGAVEVRDEFAVAVAAAHFVACRMRL